MKALNLPKETTPAAFYIPVPRRRFLKSLAAISAGFTLPGYLAEALTLTPSVTQGPYYPLASNIPLDKDNDLVHLNDSLTAASGIITYVSGRVLTNSGTPIKGALIELWHADDGGNYIYSASAARNPSADPNFAGFGQYLTGTNGTYLFRTVKAGLYRGRTRHYHFGITIPGQLTRYTTQLFWNEVAKDANGKVWDTTNTNDSVLQGISDSTQRASVIRDFTLVPGTTAAEQQTTYDFVMGLTPADPVYPGGSLTVAGAAVPGPSGSPRYKVNVPAYNGYSYEVYGNPTMGARGWAALPFTLTQAGTIDRNIYTATADGSLDLYLEAKSSKGFYFISFRVPGANTGTPGFGTVGGGPGGPPPGF